MSVAGYVSWRSHVWTDVDPDRTGVLPFVWDKDFGFERYVEYALDVPMYFLYRSGKYQDATQQRCTFREYMNGQMPDRPGTAPLPPRALTVYCGGAATLVLSAGSAVACYLKLPKRCL